MNHSNFRYSHPVLSGIVNLLLLLQIIACFSLPPAAFAGDDPFDTPSNWGGTGLMDTPTARVLKEGKYRIGLSQIYPYRYYYAAVSPFPGLEVDGRVTEILGTANNDPYWRDYGNSKDKAVDLKYQLFKEGKYLPAISLGVMDPHGTRAYSSQYLAASKQIFPFDLTVGLGNGRFGKRPIASSTESAGVEMFSNPHGWLSDAQLFAGIQFAPSDKLAFMVEYNPTKYEIQANDPARRYFSDNSYSRVNIGIRLKPLDWLEADLSFQRGNQVGINVALAFDLGTPLIPIYDHPYEEKPGSKNSTLERRIARGLNASGFRNIKVMEAHSELWVEAENMKYYYTTKAVGVMLKVIHEIAPDRIQEIHIILAGNGIPILRFSTLKIDVTEYYGEELTSYRFCSLAKMETDIHDSLKLKAEYQKRFDWGLKPDFEMFLNDPSGFFKYRLGASSWMSYRAWSGASLIGGVAVYPLNTVSTSNTPLSRPVHSDYEQYLEDDVVLQRSMFEQIYKMKHEIYARLSGGLLETEYGGFDGEVAMPLWKGRLLAGLSGSYVRKREPGSPFQFKQNDWQKHYKTGFANIRLNIPELDAWLDIKAGQFLAGDRGARFTLSKFFNGVVISAWYGATDTSIFTDNYNRGYQDKGIAVTIPIRLFSGTDSKTSYTTSIASWTRDVAQDIDHFTNLFDYMRRNTGIYLEKDQKYFE